MKKQSAGLVVYRQKDGQLEVLLAHMGGPFHAKKDAGHWTIPKGEHQPNEDALATAKREFEEELGSPPPDGELVELGAVEQKNNKTVVAWAVEGDFDTAGVKSNTFTMEWPPRSGKMAEFPEIDRAAWLSLPAAAAKIIPGQVELLERLAAKLGQEFSADQDLTPNQQTLL